MLKLIANGILLVVITACVYFLFFTKKQQIQPITITLLLTSTTQTETLKNTSEQISNNFTDSLSYISTIKTLDPYFIYNSFPSSTTTLSTNNSAETVSILTTDSFFSQTTLKIDTTTKSPSTTLITLITPTLGISNLSSSLTLSMSTGVAGKTFPNFWSFIKFLLFRKKFIEYV